jgi:peptidoglycan/LPS O-acetylase OafA/YrhL
LAGLPALAMASGIPGLSAYWSPLNFIPVALAAVLVAQHREAIQRHKTMLLVLCLALTALFAMFEWRHAVGNIFFPGQQWAIPPYTRASLLFAVIALAVVVIPSAVRPHPVIRFMAKYSLALYCLHPFLMEPMKRVAGRLTQHQPALTLGSLLLVVAGSYAMAMVLKAYLKDEVIL